MRSVSFSCLLRFILKAKRSLSTVEMVRFSETPEHTCTSEREFNQNTMKRADNKKCINNAIDSLLFTKSVCVCVCCWCYCCCSRSKIIIFFSTFKVVNCAFFTEILVHCNQLQNFIVWIGSLLFGC